MVSFHKADSKIYDAIKSFFYPDTEVEIYGRNLTSHFKQGPAELHNNAAKLDDRLGSPDLALVLLSQKYLNEDWLSNELYALINLEKFRNKQGKLVLIVCTSDVTFRRQHQTLKDRVNPDIDFRKNKEEALKALETYIQNVARYERTGEANLNSELFKQSSVKSEYYLHGTHSRVNIYSQDSSMNVSNQSTEHIFADMRQLIQTTIQNEEERSEIIGKLNELEETKGSQSFKQKYQEFISSAANHINLIAPFIPALTEMLGGQP